MLLIHLALVVEAELILLDPLVVLAEEVEVILLLSLEDVGLHVKEMMVEIQEALKAEAVVAELAQLVEIVLLPEVELVVLEPV